MLQARIRWALAVVIAGGLLVAVNGALQVRRLKGPVQTTSGIITSLHYAEDDHTARVWFRLADGREARWSCGMSNCRPSAQALRGLAWDTPMPADMQFVAGRLVGLTIREAEVIEAEPEIALRSGSHGFGAVLGAGLALAAALGLYFRRDRRKPRPRRRSTRRTAR
jgi:hypothetical protein